jgi:AraC-like DNA-binding protein
MGKTHLKTMFKNAAGMGVMEYFNRLKMEEAKRMIREGKHNFTEISQLLGFSSIYYFSRFFKKHSNMTPTEYGFSIKARASI